MKKVLAVMMALVMAFALCVPSFAEGEGSFPGIDEIINSITGAIGEMNVDEIISSIEEQIGSIGGESGSAISPEDAQEIIDSLLQQGATKDSLIEAIEQMHNEGTIDDETYQKLLDAVEAADISGISGDASDIINALRQMGMTDDQIIAIADELLDRGTITREQYDEIIRILNEEESTTEASNAGGIGGFLSGIVDAITGLFGGGSDGDGEGGEGTTTGTTTNSDEYAGKEPTGDTALLSVAAVAAVAGVALVLAKKKQK
ncbi:MAG: hypothetical protein ACI4LB_03075 [Candidatus Fimenecus sp.]